MDQSVLNRSGDKSERKNFYCDTCNSLLPAPGYFCFKCEPPCGPDKTIEDAVFDLASAFESGAIPNALNDSRYYNIKTMQNLGLK